MRRSYRLKNPGGPSQIVSFSVTAILDLLLTGRAALVKASHLTRSAYAVSLS